MDKIARMACGVTVAVAGVALAAGPAAAHMSPNEDEVPDDAFTSVTLVVGHGCDGSPTDEVTVHIPEGVTNVAPEAKPGWEIEVVEEELDEPMEGPHGDITEVVTEVIFTAEEGNELPDGFRDGFTLGFRTTATEPGDHLFFKSIQSCEEGEHAWIEEYVRGVTEGDEPEEPAPSVLVVADEADASEGDGEAAEGDEAAAAESGAVEGGSDGDDATGLAVAGLVAGLLGLGVGGAALFRTRSS